MWLQVEGKDARLGKKRVDLEDREEALEGQISEAAYLVSLPTKSGTGPISDTDPYSPQLYSPMLSHILNPSFHHPSPDSDPNTTCALTAKSIFSPTWMSNADALLCSTTA